MLASGFSNTPITRFLIVTLTLTSLLASILDVKHLLPLRPSPHLHPYLQLWRLLTWQSASTSSTELLFSVLLLYQFRVLERLWGPRKFASFVVVVAVWIGGLVPVLLAGLVVASWGRFGGGYLPAGATGLVFAGLAVWAEEVPRLYRYRVLMGKRAAASSGDGRRTGGVRGAVGLSSTTTSTTAATTTTTTTMAATATDAPGVVLSDKSTTYLIATQLALSQFPYSLLPAAVGWVVGLAWAGDLLPSRMNAWRVPRWLVGEAGDKGAGGPRGAAERERYESLRRRLEEEGGRDDGMAAAASRAQGVETLADGEARRRPMGRQIADYFRGAF